MDEALVVPADGLDDMAAHQRRAVDGIHVEQARKVASLRPPFAVLVAEGAQPVRGECHFGRLVERADGALEEVRAEPIVGIETADELSGCGSNARIPRGRKAPIGRAKHAHAPGLETAQGCQRRGLVRSVIDDDGFVIGEGLAADRVEGFFDELAEVVARDDDRHARTRHRSPRIRRCSP
jgi:hypothetical protein